MGRNVFNIILILTGVGVGSFTDAGYRLACNVSLPAIISLFSLSGSSFFWADWQTLVTPYVIWVYLLPAPSFSSAVSSGNTIYA